MKIPSHLKISDPHWPSDRYCLSGPSESHWDLTPLVQISIIFYNCMINLHFHRLVEMMCAQLKVKSTMLYSEEETAISKLSICIIKCLNATGKILTKSLIVWG